MALWIKTDEGLVPVGGGGGGGGVPDGGTTGQVLGKLSDADGDADWIDQTGETPRQVQARQRQYTFAAGVTQVTFAQPFASVPAVTVMPRLSTGTPRICWLTNATVDSFTVALHTWNGTTWVPFEGDHNIAWQAVEVD